MPRSRSAGGLRPPGEVAVHPFHRVGRDERQGTDEHPVEGDPEGVEVAAGVDRAVHAAGLLGRHVGEGAGDGLGRVGRLALAHEARGDAEAGQAHRAGGLVEHDVGRLDVLVDEAGLVEPVHGRCDGDREVEEAPRLHRCSEHPVEGLARVFEDQGGPAAVVHEVEGPDGPGRVEPLPEAILVGEAIEDGAGRGIEGRLHDQDGLAPAVADRPPIAPDDAFAIVPQDRSAVTEGRVLAQAGCHRSSARSVSLVCQGPRAPRRPRPPPSPAGSYRIGARNCHALGGKPPPGGRAAVCTDLPPFAALNCRERPTRMHEGGEAG